MWLYSQATGKFFDANSSLLERGYAGKGAAKNDPDAQCEKDTGPLPRGYYAIQAAINSPKLGPVALPLVPDESNDMCGRDDFFIHGDKINDPGNSSNGCIIMSRATRETVEASDDKRLRVVRDTARSQRQAIRARHVRT